MSRYPGISAPEPTVDSIHNTILEVKSLIETLSQQSGNREDHAVTFLDLLVRGIITPTQLTTTDSQAAIAVARFQGTVTVAALPIVSSVTEGTRAVVTDADSTTFLAPAVGGGANRVPVVVINGVWVIG